MDIRAENISFCYSDSRETPLVVEAASFTLHNGECVALVGPSGSGKSTLAQLLNGLLSPTDGRLFLDQTPYRAFQHDKRSLHRRIALVFQFPEAQIFEKTVFDEVAYAARQQRIPESEIAGRVQTALETVGLSWDDLKGRNPF